MDFFTNPPRPNQSRPNFLDPDFGPCEPNLIPLPHKKEKKKRKKEKKREKKKKEKAYLDDGVADGQAFKIRFVQGTVSVNVVHVPDDELYAVIPRVSHFCSEKKRFKLITGH